MENSPPFPDPTFLMPLPPPRTNQETKEEKKNTEPLGNEHE